MSPGLTIENCEEEDEVPLDVLDLPHLSTRPSATLLLEILSVVKVTPPSWNTQGKKSKARRSKKPESPYARLRSDPGLSRWLTTVVSSGLEWVSGEEEKEKILEEAARRLAERCGRTAMPGMTRGFKIPLIVVDRGSSGTESMDGSERKLIEAEEEDDDGVEGLDYVMVTLHEPSMTGDNLGLKTWGSSLLLARRLATLNLPLLSSPGQQGLKTLELGSGTGLVGIACAAVLGASVTLTDLPDILPNLQHNVTLNLSALSLPLGASMEARVLDWSYPEGSGIVPQSEDDKFDFVVAADAVYSSVHPALISRMIGLFLRKSNGARAVIEVPLRSMYEKERGELWRLLGEVGLVLEESGTEEGWDDWGKEEQEEEDEENGKISCWWGVYKWA